MAPARLSVAPTTVLPACLATGVGSPVSIASSTSVVPSSTIAVHRNRFAGTDQQDVAGAHLVEREAR